MYRPPSKMETLRTAKNAAYELMMYFDDPELKEEMRKFYVMFKEQLNKEKKEH